MIFTLSLIFLASIEQDISYPSWKPSAIEYVASRSSRRMTPQTETSAPISDNQLRALLLEKLPTFGEDFDAVDVQVFNGVVTIDGTVWTEQDRQEIENRIRELSPGRTIVNHVTVNPTTPRQKNDRKLS